MWEESTRPPSHIILLVSALFKSHHHAKVPKEQEWPNPEPGLDCSGNGWANPSSHQCDFYILRLLCRPSLVLCGWRGSCPDLSRKQTHGSSVSFLIQYWRHPHPNRSFIHNHGHPRGLKRSDHESMCFQSNSQDFPHQGVTVPMKCVTYNSGSCLG